METIERIDTFVNTLREANKAGLPAIYRTGTPADKLITLTGSTYDLCWELIAITKRSANSNKTATTDGINYSATNIINICIAELKNLGRTTEDAIELIATDGALWFWSLTQHPLNTLDQYINPIDRIQSINISMGNLMEWWPNKLSPANVANPNEERERSFVNLAYEATCAIIAHTH